MKKSLIFVGMLSIGFAYAQEGNVGINTDNPKATLEITPNATNLTGTTNEGLLIPRLSKARVVAIATDKLVEGTKVYVTDEVTAADTQFIGTGKGFYFYNGTKWVKQLASDTNANTELWAQRDNAGVTETYLKPANDKTDLVAYLNRGNGARNWILNIGNVQNTDLVYNATAGTGFKMEEAISGTFLSSDAFPKQRVEKGSGNFFFNYSNGIIKDSHASLIRNPSYIGHESRLVARNVTAPLGTLFGSNSSADLLSEGTAGAIYGGHMITSVGSDVDNLKPTVTNNVGGQFIARNYGTSTNMFGTATYINNYGTASNLRGVHISTNSQLALNGTTAQHTIASLRGLQNYANVNENATVTGDIYTSYNELNIQKNATLGNATIRGGYSRIITNTTTEPIASIVNYQAVFRPTGTNVGTYIDYGTYPSLQAGSSVKEYIGYNMSQGNSVADSTIENFYGVKIGNLTKGTTSNFAIHTGTRGIVHIGDKLGVGTEAPTQRIEANGNIFANEGGLMSSLNSSLGGYLELANLTKTEGKAVSRWRIYNMNTVGDEQYIPGLHFWAYAADGTNLSSQMILTDEGNLGIGFASNPNRTTQTNEKLEVNGNARIVGLKGTGDRVVYADENGVLKTGSTIAATNGVQNTANMKCEEATRGAMNFVKDVTIGSGKGDAFAVCLKGTDGKFYWRYLYGAGGVSNLEGNFGTGLE